MANVKILAGDFPKGNAKYNFGSIALNWQPGDGWLGKAVPLTDIATVDDRFSISQYGKVFHI